MNQLKSRHRNSSWLYRVQLTQTCRCRLPILRLFGLSKY